MAQEFLEQIQEVFGWKAKDIRTYSPLALAYIGDGVYDLVIRSLVVAKANRSANELHRMAVKYVKAAAPAQMIDGLMDTLTEEEVAVYHRGRNANPHTVAKNASRSDYRKATGFEALMGFLYLTGQSDRMLALIRAGVELVDQE